MKHFLLFCTLLLSVYGMHAQSYVHQVIFLNEGWYDFVNGTLVVPPSVGTYDPQTETYFVFDEIPEADFASDVLVDDVIYVAADNLLITYDKNSLARLHTVPVPGIREMAVWNDQLLISRGDYLTFFDSYFQVYDKNSLELLYALDTITGPRYAAEGIIVRDKIAYLAINNGFQFGEAVGLIGMIDLEHGTYAGEIDLGPAGINPDNIMMDDNRIYTLNNKDFASSSISLLNPETQHVSTFDMIAANSGCGTSTLADGHVYYMEYAVGKLARFDVQTLQVIDTLAETGAYYGLIDDQINGRLIATSTDFVSEGTAYLLEYSGKVLRSFEVGVSPGSIALDIRTATATDDLAQTGILIYPNPAKEVVTVEDSETIAGIQVISGTGRILTEIRPDAAQGNLHVGSLPAGMYTIRVTTVSGEVRTGRIVRL